MYIVVTFPQPRRSGILLTKKHQFQGAGEIQQTLKEWVSYYHLENPQVHRPERVTKLRGLRRCARKAVCGHTACRLGYLGAEQEKLLDPGVLGQGNICEILSQRKLCREE